MYQEAIPWVPEVFFSSTARLRTVSLLSLSVERNARDTQMTTCETEGTRRERHDKALVSRVLQLFHSTQVHACTPLTKSDEKERLLAVYEGPVFKCFVIYIVRNFEAGNS